MIVKELELRDARAVARLGAGFLPANQQESIVRLRSVILVNKLLGSGGALGLFHSDGLVGYCLGYPIGFRKKRLAKYEKQVYLSYLVILPAYRKHIRELLERTVNNLQKMFPARPGLVCSSRYYKNKWVRRGGLIRRYGYHMSGCTRYELAGQEFFLLRFEPAGIPVHSAGDRLPVPVLSRMICWAFEIYRIISIRLAGSRKRLRQVFAQGYPV